MWNYFRMKNSIVFKSQIPSIGLPPAPSLFIFASLCFIEGIIPMQNEALCYPFLLSNKSNLELKRKVF